MNKTLFLIEQSRISDALKALKADADLVTSHNAWNIQNKLQQLQQSYNYMLQYFEQGVTDEQRPTVYKSIQRQAILLNEQICYEQRLSISTIEKDNTAVNQDLIQLATKLELIQGDNQEHQNCTNVLFNKIWRISGLWTTQEFNTISQLLSGDTICKNDKLIILSAITLAVLEQFDNLKYNIIISMLASDIWEIQARAAVGTVLIAFRKKHILSYFPEISSQLSLLSDNADICSILCSTWFNLIRTIEVKDIEDTMIQDILPSIVKQSQQTLDESDDLNPDWEKLSSDSNLQNSIEQLNKLQEEGADVYISTFRPLMNIPFFYKTINCLRPFDINLPEVATAINKISSGKKTLVQLLEKSFMMCDADKYALCFTLASINSEQISLFTSQLEEQNEIVNSSFKSKLDSMSSVALTESASRLYIQNLYRLFTIHWKNHSDQTDNNIFDGNDWFETDTILSPILTNNNLSNKILDFYIRKGYYDFAYLQCQSIISQFDKSSLNYKFYQKFGFVTEHRKSNDTNKWKDAADLYNRADLLKPGQIWTWKHLANAYQHLDMWSKAAEYWECILNEQQDDIDILCKTAHAYFMIGENDKALSLFYKAYYINPDSSDIVIQIAIILTIQHKSDTANKYIEKINATKLSSTNLIKYGHLHWLNGHNAQAIKIYRQAKQIIEKNKYDWNKTFNDNISILLQQGIDSITINLLSDAINNEG